MALGIFVFDILKTFTDSLASSISVITNNVTTVSGNVTDLSTSTATNVANLQNFTISTQAAGARKPPWMSRYSIADVTYPDHVNFITYPIGNTGAASTGTAHTHTLPTGTTTSGPANFTITQNNAGGTFITITDYAVFDVVAIYAGKFSGTLNNCYLEVFRENADNSIDRISSTDISATLNATPATTYVEVPLSAPEVVVPGTRYMVRVRNSSTVAGVPQIYGVTMSTVSPYICFGTLGSSLSNQTSYTAAEVLTGRGSSTAVLWAMLAQSSSLGGVASTAAVSYSDDFNHSELGSLWYLISSWATNLGVSNNLASYMGSTNGDQNALYIRPTNSDPNRIDFDVTDSALATSHARCGGFIHATQDLSQMVYLGVTDNAVNIYSGSTGSLTSRASISTTGNDGTWTLIYDTGTDTYTAYKNGVTVGLAWASAGGTVTHSRRHRFGGIRISRVSGVNGGKLDNWTLRDYG